MTTFQVTHPDTGLVVEHEILVDGGPLCVSGVYDWREKRRIPGLFLVWFKRLGARIGPFYADIPLAHRDMRKALKAWPAAFWAGQPIEWYLRQKAFIKWGVENMGSSEALIGAEWAKD